MVEEFNNKKRVQKCVAITFEQEEFIASQRKGFSLSKFVQSKLNEYMSALKDYKEFMEEK